MSKDTTIVLDQETDYIEIIKERMEEKRYKASHLAREIDIYPSRMSAYLKQGSKLPLEKFIALCKVLDISLKMDLN